MPRNWLVSSSHDKRDCRMAMERGRTRYDSFMLPTTAAQAGSSGDPLTTGLAIVAILVSLLAVLVPAATGRQQRRRDDRAKRGEMYLELVELIERHGLWVEDLVETSHDDFVTEMPQRRTPQPERTLRVRARAIVSAYASSAVSGAFSQWLIALEAFEQKLDGFAFIAQEEGERYINPQEAEPLRDAEVAARLRVGDSVNAQLVQERRWRRRDHAVPSEMP